MRGDEPEAFKILHYFADVGADQFSALWNYDRLRGNGMSLRMQKARVNIRKYSCSPKAVTVVYRVAVLAQHIPTAVFVHHSPASTCRPKPPVSLLHIA